MSDEARLMTRILTLEDAVDQLTARLDLEQERGARLERMVDLLLASESRPDAIVADMRGAVAAADADTNPAHDWRSE